MTITTPIQTPPSLARAQAAARVILSIFETSKKRGNASALAVLRDGAGLSYGCHQATHRAGSLGNVLLAYATLQPEQSVTAMRYHKLLKDRSESNVNRQSDNHELRSWLKKVGLHDPLMLRAQEQVFNRDYMAPATAEWQRRSFTTPLSLVIVYDSFIQGSWHLCRERTSQNHRGPVSEREWMATYLNEREDFLLSLRTQDQRNSVYRPRALRQLLIQANWQLTTPFTVRSITVEEADLQGVL